MTFLFEEKLVLFHKVVVVFRIDFILSFDEESESFCSHRGNFLYLWFLRFLTHSERVWIKAATSNEKGRFLLLLNLFFWCETHFCRRGRFPSHHRGASRMCEAQFRTCYWNAWLIVFGNGWLWFEVTVGIFGFGRWFTVLLGQSSVVSPAKSRLYFQFLVALKTDV